VKANEIRNMTEPEIHQNILSMKEKLFNFRAEQASGRLERPQQLGQLKRDIAKCLTILKEKKSGK